MRSTLDAASEIERQDGHEAAGGDGGRLRRAHQQAVGLGQRRQQRAVLRAHGRDDGAGRRRRAPRLRACSAGAGRWPPAPRRRGPGRRARRRPAARAGRGSAAPGTRACRPATRPGLPGRPSTRAWPRRPNISGLPGRMAIFQKPSAMPRASSTGPTRSWSPTEAPPMVTMTSASCGLGEVGVEALARVAGDAEQTRPRRRPPRRARRRPGGWRRRSGRGRACSPGGTSSSPVARMATRGRRRTGSVPWPMAAASATSRGPRRRPAASSVSPSRKSKPRVRTWPVSMRALAHGDLVAVARGVLLDDDGIGAGGQRRAGEDAHGLARGRRCRRRDGRRRPAPITASVAGSLRDVGRAHGVAVHGGGIERRLRQQRGERLRPACAGAPPRWRRSPARSRRRRRRGCGRRASSTESGRPWRSALRRLRPRRGRCRSGRRSSRRGGCRRASWLCRRP